MRKLLKDFLYFILFLIEKVQYRKMNLDENDDSKKILESFDLNLPLKTDKGYSNGTYIHLTQPYTHYKLNLENGLELTGADNHIIFKSNFSEVFIKDLKKGDIIKTDKGDSVVKSLKKLNRKSSMFDITIDSEDHRYYTNGILSHNTVSSAIYILHYMLFNNNKNILIAANKGDTAIEILDKCKDIYLGLPFFLQKGITVWNQKTIKFENGSKSKAFTMTATSSIGQSADLVYLDEFAYIPETIANAFYKSIQPTLVAIENSKMIITSTPNGMNLFYKLLTDAEREDGDPLKNNFASMRVYWYQVPGRNVTYIRTNTFKMANNNIDFDIIYKTVKDIIDPNDLKDPNGLPIVSWKKNGDTGEKEIHVQNTEEFPLEKIKAIKYTNRDGDSLPIGVIGDISSWKLDAIKNIGGIEAFNQEYDLRFINASKSLFNESVMKRIQDSKVEFKFMPHDIFDRLKWDWSGLKFIDDTSVFNITDRKNVMGVISVDVAEGLGLDYSIINIFKITEKDNETILNNQDKYSTFVDYYCLEQIGMFRSNLVSVTELSELLYLLAFEFFDEQNFKVVLEVNNHGHAVLESIKNVFNQDNNYGSDIFFRFKHRQDSALKKIGMKVSSGNKNMLVKNYQETIINKSLIVHHKNTINEIGTFIKHTTKSGGVTYQADGTSNDDSVMTCVNICAVFQEMIFHDMVEDYQRRNNNIWIKEQLLNLKDGKDNSGTDYEVFSNTSRIARHRSKNKYK
jgi:hypothetical protein